MPLTKTITFFEDLITKTDIKSEIKIYNSFIAILTDLKSKKLTQKQYQVIEKELDKLELKLATVNKKRYFNKKLNIFKNYLLKEFSLITEGYYTAIGLSLGMAFGVAFGASFGKSLGISLGISLGLVFGVVIGSQIDAKAKSEGRVLKTKP